jgi:hypothetical protein
MIQSLKSPEYLMETFLWRRAEAVELASLVRDAS